MSSSYFILRAVGSGALASRLAKTRAVVFEEVRTMKFAPRLRIVFVVSLLLVFVVGASAQLDKKPYTEWSEKDALKVLNNSAWAQTQTVTDTSLAFQSPSSNAGAGGNTRGGGPTNSNTRSNDLVNINFRVRLFSAKPVREAFSRMIELQQEEKLSDAMQAQLKDLVEAKFDQHIIVTITPDSSAAAKKLNESVAALRRASVADFKNNTYISVKGKERLFLTDYQPPSKDGFGAKFIFPRQVDGQPYITQEGGEIFFRTELGSVVNISVRYKVKDMMYQGKLEY